MLSNNQSINTSYIVKCDPPNQILYNMVKPS